MQPISENLLLLAHQFAAQEAYQQAVQCLLALCTTQTTELPSVLAQARLQLACLLLDHFDNLIEAKAVLLTAEQDLRQMHGHHLLKCEVWDALARCHQKLGAVAAEQHALAAGLKVCQQGAASKDGELLARWAARFRFKQVEHAQAHTGREAAAAALRALGDEPGALNGLERVLRLLAAATLALAGGDAAPVAGLLEQLSPLIEEVAAGQPLLHKQLRCHYSVVYIAMAAAVGRINDLSQEPGGTIALLSTLRGLLGEIGDAPWAYAWLPAPAVAALASLLHASLLRSLGRGAAAATHLAAAAEAVEQQLAAVGIDLQATEADLRLQALWEGRVYCQLAVAVLEQRTLCALGAARFAEAGALAAALTALLDRFPSLLRDFVPAVLMLLGHYAHSLGQHGAAAARFRSVLAADSAEAPHDAAAAAAALAELHADEGPAALGAALEVLQQRGLTDLTHTLSLAVQDRTAALLASALIARRSGDDANARVLLTKALKAAHAHLGNTQMVAQVLNVLAPIQAAKGDVAGAEQMLGSATTLAKAQGDLPTLVASSRALLGVFAGVAGDAGRAAKQREYAERKAGDLAAAAAAAAATPEHAALLAWAPPRQA